MADTVLAHPDGGRALVGLFAARFDPALDPRPEPTPSDDALAAVAAS